MISNELKISNIQNKILTLGLNVKLTVKIWSIFVDILENTNLKCSFNHEALNQVLRFFHFFLCFGTIWILWSIGHRSMSLSVLVCCLCRLVDRNNHRWRFGTFKSLTDATYFLARQAQNLHWNLRQLTPSFGSTLAVWLEKCFFLGIKPFVFQGRELKLSVSVWNWISWNLIKIQLIPLIQTIIWLSWNFVRFHDFFFQTDSESFSFLSWKTKKFYS